jgi:cysteinyl-tRNA synthetase
LNVHRINPDTSKRNPRDFALWKKKDEEPFWDSPWGKGRPGWHIEDTAITEEYFGPQYDIHGGGLDLIFPHHEAEIAQMESASGQEPMVRYWMHTGFLNVKGEKMSKSLGNFITIKELLQEYSPDVFRFFIISTHYRSPIDFSEKILEQSKNSLERIHKLLNTIEELEDSNLNESGDYDEKFYAKKLIETKEKFLDAMDNDFNTPSAISTLFDLIREINSDINESRISKNSLHETRHLILEFGYILGFDFSDRKTKNDVSKELLEILTDVRENLRQNKNWELSDEIRSRLNDLDITLEDKLVSNKLN